MGTQQIPADSGDKHLEKCGMGPTSTRVAPCFGVLGFCCVVTLKGPGSEILLFPNH